MELLDRIENEVGRILDEAQQRVGSGKPLDRILDRGEAPVKRLAEMANEDVRLFAFIDFGKATSRPCSASNAARKSVVRRASCAPVGS